MKRNEEFQPLLDRAQAASRLLAGMANANRLLALCHLADAPEMAVGRLAELVGISQSALSQHLAKLRSDGVVATRKDKQTVYYRLKDQRVLPLLLLLRDQFCPELQSDRRPSQ